MVDTVQTDAYGLPVLDDFGRPIPIIRVTPDTAEGAITSPSPNPETVLPEVTVTAPAPKPKSAAKTASLPVPPIPPSNPSPAPQAPSPLNDPYALITSTYRPTLRVLYGGREIPFALSAEVNTNNWYQADRFSAEFAIWADPLFGPNWWGGQDKNEILLDIQYVLGDEQPVSLIIGRVDHLDLDWMNGKLRIEGRDLTSNFIDHRVYGSFQNQTSSQIVAQLAGKYGMSADVDQTSTPISRFYESEHTDIQNGEFQRSMTEWDLMVWLAQHEGNENGAFNVWVTGQTLHFRQAQAIEQMRSWTIQVSQPQYHGGVTNVMFVNATDLRLQRSLTIAKDVVVSVRSWNSQQFTSFTVTSPKGSQSASSKDPAQKYVIVRPNLTKDQAQTLADNTREDITRHERIIEWTDAGGFPNSLQLTPRDAVLLQGTQSSWDQSYFIDNISRHLSVEGGLKITVRAKNHSTLSESIAI